MEYALDWRKVLLSFEFSASSLTNLGLCAKFVKRVDLPGIDPGTPSMLRKYATICTISPIVELMSNDYH